MSEVGDKDSISKTSSAKKKYALVMGVNGSDALESVKPLLFAESDAVGLCWLLEREECGFVFPTKGLIGEGGTAAAVHFAIGKMINQSSDGDLLLFYFLCHSHQILKRDHSVETFLVTADFNPELALRVPGAYLSLSAINEMFSEENLEERDIIIVLDCCEAGNIMDPLKLDQQVTQLLRAVLQKPQLRSEPLRAIIASTRADSPAFERRGHLVMTGLVLAALEGKAREALNTEGHLTIHSLYDYLQNQMNREKLGRQVPRMRGNFSGRQWVLATHPAREPIKTSPQEFLPRPTLTGQTFDMTLCDARLDDLDFEQITRFLQKQRVVLQDDYHPHHDETESMESLSLLRNGRPTYGTLLCYGRNPARFVVGAYTRCVYWHSDSRVQGWKDEKEYRGSLLEQFDAASGFLRKYLGDDTSPSQETEEGKIPFRVLQEALVNALVHREYAVEPDHRFRPEGVQIEIYRDRVDITSPGKLPPEINLDMLKSASHGHPLSYPRNPQIMRIFYLAGHVERLGTGIKRMQHLMDEAGLALEIEEQVQAFTVILHRSATSKLVRPGRKPPTKALPPPPIDEPEDGEEASPWSHDAQTDSVWSDPHSYRRSAPASFPDPYTPVPSSRLRGDPSETPTKKREVRLPDDDASSSEPAGKRRFSDIGKGSSVPFSRRLGKRRGFFVALISVLLLLSTSLGVGWRSGLLSRVFPAPASSPVGAVPIISPPNSTTIEIATDFPTGGVDTLSGSPLQNGVQMAITQANNENFLPGGYTLKLIPYNDVGAGNRHDPQVGARNLQQAKANPLIAGVVGPANSSVAIAELPVVNQAPIALLSPSVTNPCLTKSGTDDPSCATASPRLQTLRPTSQLTFFRLVTTDDVQGKATAEYFFNVAHYRKVLLLKDDSDPYSLGLSQAFDQEWQTLGGQVIPLDLPQVSSSEQDYQVALRAVAPTQPDLIYFAGDDPNGTYALQALASIPELKSVAFAGGDGIIDNDLPQAAAKLSLSAPVYGSLPVVDPNHVSNSTGADFETNYTANGFTNYRPYAASAYDCTMMLIEAIKEALQQGTKTPRGEQDQAGGKHFREAVLQALAHLSYTGATGKHSFDANGDTTNHTISIYRLNATVAQPTWAWQQQISA